MRNVKMMIATAVTTFLFAVASTTTVFAVDASDGIPDIDEWEEPELEGTFQMEDIATADTPDGVFDEVNTVELVKGQKLNLPKVCKLEEKLSNWQSADKRVCTVKNGTIKGVGQGVTTVSGTCGKATYVLRVIVDAPAVICNEITVAVGEELPVDLEGFVHEDGRDYVDWSSRSTKNIAIVNPRFDLIVLKASDEPVDEATMAAAEAKAQAYNGAMLVRGIAVGKAKITAKYGKRRYTIKVNVVPNASKHTFSVVKTIEESTEESGRPIPEMKVYADAVSGACYTEYSERTFTVSYYDEDYELIEAQEHFWGDELSESEPEMYDYEYFEGWYSASAEDIEAERWDFFHFHEMLEDLPVCTGSLNFIGYGAFSVDDYDWDDDDDDDEECGDDEDDPLEITFLDFYGDEYACQYTYSGYIKRTYSEVFESVAGDDLSSCGWMDEDGIFIPVSELLSYQFTDDATLTPVVTGTSIAPFIDLPSTPDDPDDTSENDFSSNRKDCEEEDEEYDGVIVEE